MDPKKEMAFPLLYGDGPNQLGLTKFEYAAIHAPDVVPDWFEHIAPFKPERMNPFHLQYGKNSNHKDRELVAKYFNDENNEWAANSTEVPEQFKKEIEGYLKKYDANFDELKEWEVENKGARYFQWRTHFAKIIFETIKEEK